MVYYKLSKTRCIKKTGKYPVRPVSSLNDVRTNPPSQPTTVNITPLFLLLLIHLMSPK